MTVSQDRPQRSRRELRDDVPAGSATDSDDTANSDGSVDTNGRADADAGIAASPSINAPQRTPGGRRVRWDPSAAEASAQSAHESGDPSSDDEPSADEQAAVEGTASESVPGEQTPVELTPSDQPPVELNLSDQDSSGRDSGRQDSSTQPAGDDSAPDTSNSDPSSTEPMLAPNAPAHQAAGPTASTDAGSAPVRAPIRPRAGRRSSFAPSFLGSSASGGQSGSPATVGETPPSDIPTSDTAALDPDTAALDSTTPDAPGEDVSTVDTSVADSSIADDSIAESSTSNESSADASTPDSFAADSSTSQPGPADGAVADGGQPVTDQAPAPERTMTRRELRALRARAEAAGRPAPDVIFLPDGGTTVTGAIDIIDPAEAQRFREERRTAPAVTEVETPDAEATGDGATDTSPDGALGALPSDSDGGTDGFARTTGEAPSAPEADAAGVVTELPADESDEVAEDAVIELDDEPAEHDSREPLDAHGRHDRPVADEAGVVTEDSGTNETLDLQAEDGELPGANADVQADDGEMHDVHDADADAEIHDARADDAEIVVAQADDGGLSDGQPRDDEVLIDRIEGETPGDRIDDRTPVIPALIEPPETGSIRFQPDPSAFTPSEIVVDAEPVTGETAPVREEEHEPVHIDEPAPGPSSLRPFDAMFLPPSARDGDGTEIDTSSVQPLNDTDGLRGDILAAPEGAARPFGHWSTQDGDDEERAIDALLSRDIGVSTGAVTTHALVLPSIPDAGEPLLSPLTSTGEVMVTGSVDLPRSYGSTGAHPALFDHPDVDALIDDADREDADSGVAPVRATRAVSSTTTTQAMIGSEAVPRSRWLAITAIIVGGVVLVAAASWAIAALVFNAF